MSRYAIINVIFAAPGTYYRCSAPFHPGFGDTSVLLRPGWNFRRVIGSASPPVSAKTVRGVADDILVASGVTGRRPR
jgi:hypothetical protein